MPYLDIGYYAFRILVGIRYWILCFLTVNRISTRCQPFVCWIHHLASHHHISLRARRSAQIILVTGSNERTVYLLRIAILFAIPSLPFSKETEPSCSPSDSSAPRDLVPLRLLRRVSLSAPPPPVRALPTVADRYELCLACLAEATAALCRENVDEDTRSPVSAGTRKKAK